MLEQSATTARRISRLATGAKEASITVETDDGHVLIWRRKGATVSYIIDGREVHRLRGGVPEDLHKYLQMPAITAAGGTGEPFYVHFGLQKSPIFLLDDSASRAATFFASSSDAEKLLEMQRRHKENVRDANRRCWEPPDGELVRLDAKLAALSSMDELTERVEEIERRHEKIAATDQVIAAGAQHVSDISRCEHRREQLTAELAALTPLSPPPQPAETRPIEQLISKIEAAMKAKARIAGMHETLSPLEPPPMQADERLVVIVIHSLATANMRVAVAHRRLEKACSADPRPRANRRRSLRSVDRSDRDCVGQSRGLHDRRRANLVRSRMPSRIRSVGGPSKHSTPALRRHGGCGSGSGRRART